MLNEPNFAVVAVAAGVLIASVEFIRPGWVWPGVAGGVLALTGASRLAARGLNPAGLALVALGSACVLSILWFARPALLAAAGTLLIAAGLLFITKEPPIHWWVAGPAALMVSVGPGYFLASAARARRIKRLLKQGSSCGKVNGG